MGVLEETAEGTAVIPCVVETPPGTMSNPMGRYWFELCLRSLAPDLIRKHRPVPSAAAEGCGGAGRPRGGADAPSALPWAA